MDSVLDAGERRARSLRVEGRLKPGFSHAAAQAELQVLASRQDRLHPGRTTKMHVTGGAGIEEPGAAPRLFWVLSLVLGALAVVLLLVCVNVSLLMLSQASSRHREIAVRLSLGAGRARLLRMLLTQSLLMAGAAGAASAWMAYWFPSAFLALANLRVDYSLAPDWRVFLYLGVIAMGAGCAAGLAPASESLKTDLTSAIKGHPGHLGMTRWKMRDSLVTAQVALSLLLLAAAGLLAKATYGALTGDPGFEADRVLVAYSPLPFPPYTTASAASFYREFAGRVAVLPGVESVAFATSIRSGDSIELVKSHARLSDPGSQASVNQVSPEFFRTLGIRLIRGRTFTSEEASVAAPVTVVSETLARKLWPGEDPLGRQLVDKRGAVLEVVGITRDIEPALGVLHAARAQFYRVLVPRTDDDDLLIRYSGDMKPLQPAVREIARSMDRELRLSTESLRGLINRTVGDAGHMTALGLCFGVVALLLAVIGLYGVVAFAAAERTHEFGIRMALGATRAQILRLVQGTGWKPVWIGLAAGIAMAWGAAVGLEQVLKRSPVPLDGRDPVLYLSVAALMGLAAILAMLGPAWRAAHSDPAATLRCE